MGDAISRERNLARYETALDVLNMMTACLAADIAVEERKPRPNEVEIARVVSTQAAFLGRARVMHPDDQEEIERVIHAFGPVLRARRLRRGD